METVDPGDRKIVDGEAKRLIRLDAKRLAERRTDCTAMRYRNDIASGMMDAQAQHRIGDARHDGGETLAIRHRIMCRRDPERMILARPIGRDLGIAHTLPIAETLLAQTLFDQRIAHRMAGLGDGARGLMGALQMAGNPKRALGQLRRQA